MIFWLLLMAAEKPVLRLDEIYVEGHVRRPPVTEVEASRLNAKIEEAALSNLLKLEKRLTAPITFEEYQRAQTRH